MVPTKVIKLGIFNWPVLASLLEIDISLPEDSLTILDIMSNTIFLVVEGTDDEDEFIQFLTPAQFHAKYTTETEVVTNKFIPVKKK